MITNKKHNQIIEHKNKTINDYLSKILKLEQELKEAKDLKAILEKVSSMSVNGINFSACGGTFYTETNLSENVLVYVDDMLGGKVIKQEGTKCVVLDKNGNMTTGLTKQKPDKGFNYKLIRQK